MQIFRFLFIVSQSFKGSKKLLDERITILFWNSFWVYPLFAMGEGNTGFIKNKCKYTNCFTTHQRSELFRSDKKVDAVVVHGWDKELSDNLKFGRILGMQRMVIPIF